MRFTTQNNIITDQQTGFMWSAESFGPLSLREALQYCHNLRLGNFSDWRLPSFNEYYTLVDYNYSPPGPAADPIFNMQTTDYWSSTESGFNTMNVMNMDFFTRCFPILVSKRSVAYVRAFRTQ